MNTRAVLGLAVSLLFFGCGGSASTSNDQMGAVGAGGAGASAGAGTSGAAGNGGPLLGAGGIAPIGAGGIAPIGAGGGIAPIGFGSGGSPFGQGGAFPIGAGGALLPPPPGGGGVPGAGGAGVPPPPGGAAGMVTNLPPGGTDPTKLPVASGDCPTIASGTVMISGIPVILWVGNKSTTQKGPIFIYWHGTGGDGSNAAFDLDPTLRSEILGLGGVIAAPNGSTGTGSAIDWGVWTGDDMKLADQVVACSITQLNIDTHRIYVGGASAGGLMAGAMTYQRSGYIAASNPNSGGLAPWPGLGVLQDPAHPPAVLTMHGKMGVDMVVIDFAQVSISMDHDIVAKGGFAVDCDHGGGHTAAPADLKAAGWVFMKAHPYGTKPSPYAGGLPASFPSYCTIMKAM